MDFAFVGNINQTNSIIAETLQNNFDAEISFFCFTELFEAYSNNVSSHPRLIIIDLDTTTGFGKAPANIDKIAKHFVNTPILVIQPYYLPKLINPLIHAGAKGLISTAPSAQTIIQAVQQLLDGNEFISTQGSDP